MVGSPILCFSLYNCHQEGIWGELWQLAGDCGPSGAEWESGRQTRLGSMRLDHCLASVGQGRLSYPRKGLSDVYCLLLSRDSTATLQPSIMLMSLWQPNFQPPLASQICQSNNNIWLSLHVVVYSIFFLGENDWVCFLLPLVKCGKIIVVDRFSVKKGEFSRTKKTAYSTTQHYDM